MKLLVVRNTGYILGLFVVLSFERVVGLPLFFLIGGTVLVQSFKTFNDRVIVAVLLSWSLAVVFHLPFTVSLCLWLGGLVFLDHGRAVIKKYQLRLMLMVVVMSVVIILFNRAQIGWLQLVLASVSVSSILFLSRVVLVWEQRSSLGLNWNKKVWQLPELKSKS